HPALTPMNQDSESGKAGQARPDDVTSTRRNKTHILSFNPKAKERPGDCMPPGLLIFGDESPNNRYFNPTPRP
ncbi:MAG: hypothetical protein U0N15_03475, partial [Bifidobacterium choerinum]